MNTIGWYACCGLATLGAQRVFERVRGANAVSSPTSRPRLVIRVRNAVLEAAALMALWPLVVLMILTTLFLPKRKYEPEQPFGVELGHLIACLDITEIERRERVSDPLGAVPDLPFGHLHEAWQAFLAKRSPGQRIWSFDATGIQWGTAWRKAGYVLVGDQGIADHFIVLSCDLDPAARTPFPAQLLHARYD